MRDHHEEPDWSRRPRGGWEDFLEARRRLMRTLAANAETVRLERLWLMSGGGDPPPPEPGEPPRSRDPEAGGGAGGA